jgi:hypothetical protein
MAINYPTSLDSFTNPTATDLLTSPSHAQQHADINDAMEAVQTKLAIGNTVVGTYTAYTPTFTNLTVGNGTSTARFSRVNNIVNYFGYFTLGTTSSLSASAATITLPVTANSIYGGINGLIMGNMTAYDASTGTWYKGEVMSIGSTTSGLFRNFVANGVFLNNASNVVTTDPMTWTTSDQLIWNITYEAA